MSNDQQKSIARRFLPAEAARSSSGCLSIERPATARLSPLKGESESKRGLFFWLVSSMGILFDKGSCMACVDSVAHEGAAMRRFQVFELLVTFKSREQHASGVSVQRQYRITAVFSIQKQIQSDRTALSISCLAGAGLLFKQASRRGCFCVFQKALTAAVRFAGSTTQPPVKLTGCRRRSK